MLNPAGAHQVGHGYWARDQGRDLTYAAEADTGDERIRPPAVPRVSGRVIRLHHRSDLVSSATFPGAGEPAVDDVSAWLGASGAAMIGRRAGSGANEGGLR
jgi:hypothetical protein